MAHVSLYRKYRSQTFGDLVGQPHVVRSLQNAIASSRIAHAYLFTGPRGTGKTSTARLLAKALCCEKGPTPEPCNVCDICLSIAEGTCMDVLEMDAASESGVDDVRDTIVRVAEYAPSRCRYRVFIVDEVHDLSAKAFDALLKTVEEPPAHLVFVLATTEYNKVPPTIRSRCQKFEFHRGSIADLVSRLEHVCKSEGAQAEPQALSAIARMSDGAYRDALNLLEQAMLTADGTITLQHVYDQLGLIDESSMDALLFAIREGNVGQVLETVESFLRLGRDPRSVLESGLYRLADLTRAACGLESLGPGNGPLLASSHEAATRLGHDAILEMRSAFATAIREIRDVSLPRLWLESRLIGLARELSASSEKQRLTSPKAFVAQPEVRARSAHGKVSEASEPAAATPAQGESANTADKQAQAAPPVDEETSPELRKPAEVWRAVVSQIEATGGNKAITRQLSATRVVAFDGATLTVEFSRQIDHDGITGGPNGPRRLAKIREMVQKQSGEPWEVAYTVSKRSPNGAATALVELPLEGSKLLEAARDVFPGA